jgi:hypothetical protein
MSLTAVQQRTFDALIGRGPAPEAPPGLPERLRARLEEGVAGLDLPEPLWLGKRSLAVHPRCEGLFESVVRGEEPFELRREGAAGTLTHRAVHLDVASERTQDVRTLVERAVPDEQRDARFDAWWRDRDPIDQAEILQEAARDLALFRDLFPPIDRHWQPLPEQSLRVKLAGGRVVLSGRVDLMLGRTRKLLLDLKTGDPPRRPRRGHAALRPPGHALLRGSAVPRGHGVRGVARVPARGRHRGDARSCRRAGYLRGEDRGRAARGEPGSRAHPRPLVSVVPPGGRLPGRARSGGLTGQDR